MKRDIIRIDETKCNGCGQCVPDCPEGALRIIDGKARLVGDLFCDGLGACIGRCPQGAITVENRESEPYDEARVMANVVRGGTPVIRAHLKHLSDHGQDEYLAQAQDYLRANGIPMPGEEPQAAAGCGGGRGHGGGCPGSRTVDLRNPDVTGNAPAAGGPVRSELRQWPVQLHLVDPDAPYFRDADIVVAADCVPFAFGDFHRRFLQGKSLIIFCPKLDRSNDAYVEKLSRLFSNNAVRSVTMVHMEVPCCSGVSAVVQEALARSGKNVVLREYTVSISGEIV